MAMPGRIRRLEGRHAIVDGIRYQMPIDSSEAGAIIAAFPINYDKAAALLPPGDVHPFRLWTKALLIATVVNYRKTDIGSYIEYSLAIACTHGAKPAPRLLPAIFMGLFGTGQYVVDLPVSTEVSVKGGKGIWGMPKHRTSLDFVEGGKWVSAQYDLDGQQVVRFDVKRPPSTWFPINAGAANYCSFRGMIMKSFIYFTGKVGFHLFRPNAARLVFGDHPRAQWMKDLEIGPSIFSAHFGELTGVLDDRFECWFITPETRPEGPIGEGLETTYPLGYDQTWPPDPVRDPSFDPDKED